MDDNTYYHIEEHLGLALGHLHKALDGPDYRVGREITLALDVAICQAKVQEVLDDLRSLRKEAQLER